MEKSTEIPSVKHQSLREVLEDLNFDYKDIFHIEFMEEYTDFSSIDQFFESAGWFLSDGSIKNKVMIKDADDFTNDHTDFSDWDEFMDEALQSYWKSPGKNRRQHERYPCDMEVLIEANMDNLKGRLADISKSGFRVQSNEDLPEVRTIKVTLPKSESKFSSEMQFRGAVRWHNDGNPEEMGIEILSKKKV